MHTCIVVRMETGKILREVRKTMSITLVKKQNTVLEGKEDLQLEMRILYGNKIK
jgi:hypothetical protein